MKIPGSKSTSLPQSHRVFRQMDDNTSFRSEAITRHWLCSENFSTPQPFRREATTNDVGFPTNDVLFFLVPGKYNNLFSEKTKKVDLCVIMGFFGGMLSIWKMSLEMLWLETISPAHTSKLNLRGRRLDFHENVPTFSTVWINKNPTVFVGKTPSSTAKNPRKICCS